MPSVKINAIANFIGQAFTSFVGILVMPFYLQYLGGEAFGLVGFFLVMLAWLPLLDMGMTPALSREAARARGRNGFTELAILVRSLELFFTFFVLALATSVFAASGWIARSWLQVETISSFDVAYCVSLMGVTIGIRWFATLYRGGIQGMEQQVWLNGANIVFSGLRFIGALALLRFVSSDPRHFFEYQLAVSIVEFVVSRAKLYRLMPKSITNVCFSVVALKRIVPFAASVGFTSGVWVLLTQLDKLLLSNILSLKEYGYFTLVTMISLGIMMLSGPIAQALLPRMTYLLSQEKEKEMLELYKKATQYVVVLAIPIAGAVAIFSTELIYVWTGDLAAASWGGPVLFWYAIGSGILGVSAFQYYLQYAHGNLKLHVLYNVAVAAVSVPLIVFTAYRYGAIGVAISWFIVRLISFFVWPPIVHRKFAPGIHYSWLVDDIAPAAISSIILLLISSYTWNQLGTTTRVGTGVFVLVSTFTILVLSGLSSRETRKFIFSKLRI